MSIENIMQYIVKQQATREKTLEKSNLKWNNQTHFLFYLLVQIIFSKGVLLIIEQPYWFFAKYIMCLYCINRSLFSIIFAYNMITSSKKSRVIHTPKICFHMLLSLSFMLLHRWQFSHSSSKKVIVLTRTQSTRFCSLENELVGKFGKMTKIYKLCFSRDNFWKSFEN